MNFKVLVNINSPVTSVVLVEYSLRINTDKLSEFFCEIDDIFVMINAPEKK